MITLAEGMGRLGTETAFEVLARAEALKQQGKDIINNQNKPVPGEGPPPGEKR